MDEPRTRADRRAATAQRILDAAQVEFGERGLDAATVRGIAQRAGVDPSLVLQHYGSKDALFAVATRLDGESSSGEIAQHLMDVLHLRLAELPPHTHALLRSMLTSSDAAEAMSEYLGETVTNLAATAHVSDAELRATLVSSSILGLTIARHFLHLTALESITDAQLSDVVEPWLQSALTGGPRGS